MNYQLLKIFQKIQNLYNPRTRSDSRSVLLVILRYPERSGQANPHFNRITQSDMLVRRI